MSVLARDASGAPVGAAGSGLGVRRQAADVTASQQLHAGRENESGTVKSLRDLNPGQPQRCQALLPQHRQEPPVRRTDR